VISPPKPAATLTHRAACVTALAGALAVAAPAVSAPLTFCDSDEQVTVVVHYVDADLRSPKAAARLANRVRSAARRVCGGDDPVVATGVNFAACQDQAIDRALATLDAPLLVDALGRGPNATVAHR
jgi:UrcA family protein